MLSFVTTSQTWVANFAAINSDVQSYLRPLMFSLIGLAGVVSAFFLVTAGIAYTTSSGNPEKLEHAKRVLRNAIIGLVLVIGAGTLTAILTTAYNEAGGSTITNIPALTPVDTVDGGGGITEILINAIIGLFKHIIETAATPFIAALDYFTHSTPLMGDNPAVFNLWLTVVGIANALFVLVVALLGFHVMSAASLGLDEIEFKHLLPKLGVTFLLMNMSLFAIDTVIALSNVMVGAIESAYSSISVWDALSSVAGEAGSQGLVALLIMVVFMVLSAILLVYYVMRIVTLYVGAILAPIVILLQMLPGFKDFAATAIKTYTTNTFVLFVHAIILTLSATLFAGIQNEVAEQPFDPVMAMVIGVATLMTLLKTQGVMMQMSYVSTGPKALRKLGGQFMNGVSYTSGKYKSSRPKAVALTTSSTRPNHSAKTSLKGFK